jgi:predicted secreted protein
MIRSRKCIFISHCLLAQGVRANGLAKYFPGPIPQILEFCQTHAINIMQMPCPELQCSAGGLGREPHGKAWYEANGLRDVAREIATSQATYMKRLVDGGYEIVGIVGMEFSPACATRFLNKGQRIYHSQGIYIEELVAALRGMGIDLPMVGMNPRGLKKLRNDLEGLLSRELPGQATTTQPSNGDQSSSSPSGTK